MIKNLVFIGALLLASEANSILTMGSEREVTLRTADAQLNPDIAASASGLRLAAWSETIGNGHRLGVMASRIDATGATLDVAGIDLGASTLRTAYPKVASNGTDWLVVWNDAYNIFACRVAQDGRVLDDHPIPISAAGFLDAQLSVVWDGYSYVVACLDGYWFHGLHVSPTYIRVTTEGLILKKVALTPPGEFTWISIAAGGEGSLIVWGTGAAILSRTDTITPIALTSSSDPSVVRNGHDFFVTSYIDDYTPRWQFVSGTGVVGTPFTLFAEQMWYAEATPFGDGFLWYRWFDGETFVEFMNDRGELVDGPVKIPGADGAFRADGNMIIYARAVGDTVPGIARVFVRLIEGAPLPRRRAVR